MVWQDKQRAMESTEKCFLFLLSASQLQDLQSTFLLSRAFTSQLYIHSHSHNSFFFWFFWIPADRASVQFLLFLALLQFHKERFETERLYVSSEVSWKQKTAGWHRLKSLWQLQTCVCDREMEPRKEIKTHAGWCSYQINVTNTMKATFGWLEKYLLTGHNFISMSFYNSKMTGPKKLFFSPLSPPICAVNADLSVFPWIPELSFHQWQAVCLTDLFE